MTILDKLIGTLCEQEAVEQANAELGALRLARAENARLRAALAELETAGHEAKVAWFDTDDRQTIFDKMLRLERAVGASKRVRDAGTSQSESEEPT